MRGWKKRGRGSLYEEDLWITFNRQLHCCLLRQNQQTTFTCRADHSSYSSITWVAWYFINDIQCTAFISLLLQ